ncbi:MAG: hypothetical protein FWE30_05750 [Bacteroidales bacterium]|nr:hypothetical protein [Bacteroidales bacterium]MCL2738932.1 hypothetical protein [Bacteroidales bacterium]
MNLHLFIAGTGGVGKALMSQIRHKHGFLMQHQEINIVVHGIINSRFMRLSRQGISLHEPLEEGSEWKEADLTDFIDFIKQRRIPNAVFADLTASDRVAATYLDLLQNGIHVVACNKIACSAPMSHYAKLKAASKESGAVFLYNTNVGAALPYLQSIRQLYLAGERIDRIEAILSGTLSYIFGRYDGTIPFAHIVRDAHQAGYTEPDPRIDLQGIDVMRKLLILCREVEIPLEEHDIIKTSFLPESCLRGSIDDFYHALLHHEECFKQRYVETQAQCGKLKYIASYCDGKASVGLQCVPPQHPTFNLSPKDNILLVYSENYLSPLAITGAGAGGQGTAMGVLSDIVSVALSMRTVTLLH